MSWTGPLVLLLALYWVLVVVAIIAEDRPPTESAAWILVLMLLPGIGLVLYFLAGRDWKGWLAKQPEAREWLATRIDFMKTRYAPHREFSDRSLKRFEESVAGQVSRSILADQQAPPLPATAFEVYPSGAEYFPVLIDDIASAQHFVHMQYFIWEHDELTAEVTNVLLERLRAGVSVRILNDFLGSLPYKKDELRRLSAAGAHVSYDMKQLGRLNYRNHRKITVVDGDVGHTGGVNLGQEYIDGGKKYPAWRDTGLRITGPIVAELSKLFADRWYEVNRESLLEEAYFPPSAPDGAPIVAQVVAHGVEDPWESARRAHAVAIGSARHRVWLQSPYFVPDEGTYDALIGAALAGVDVRLMMTEWPDHKLAWRAAESYFRPLLSAGGRIFRWAPGFFHAKSVTVDGIACAIGTMNLDIRSLKLHKELMVWAYGEAPARRCEEIFLADQELCQEVELDDVAEWSRGHAFVNSAARLTSNVI